jgi:hypothetical protein
MSTIGVIPSTTPGESRYTRSVRVCTYEYGDDETGAYRDDDDDGNGDGGDDDDGDNTGQFPAPRQQRVQFDLEHREVLAGDLVGEAHTLDVFPQLLGNPGGVRVVLQWC